MKRPKPQQTLGLRLVEKKGLDAYAKGYDGDMEEIRKQMFSQMEQATGIVVFMASR